MSTDCDLLMQQESKYLFYRNPKKIENLILRMHLLLISSIAGSLLWLTNGFGSYEKTNFFANETNLRYELQASENSMENIWKAFSDQLTSSAEVWSSSKLAKKRKKRKAKLQVYNVGVLMASHLGKFTAQNSKANCAC